MKKKSSLRKANLSISSSFYSKIKPGIHRQISLFGSQPEFPRKDVPQMINRKRQICMPACYYLICPECLNPSLVESKSMLKS
ncbi:hypothetical protein BpHYR1_038349 [Brachionus plicatilis]|uniref:Uncharacterized protein n=1 Tax=Brachionus plicatilis TaxID=10195 RepID=A0A3M7RDT5_BRAPC|nr:hypothetical protein BpHYR1_038349 [Brachionus plicatilis]